MTNNGWMDEIDDFEIIKDTEENLDNFEDTIISEPINFEETIVSEPINPELHKIMIAQQNLGEELELLRNYNPTPEINEKIQKCEHLIIELEEIINVMNELGPTTTINEAMTVRKERQKESLENNSMRKPKTLVLTNPNVPSELLPAEPEINKHPDNSFFKSFIYMALTCGALMGAYISILF